MKRLALLALVLGSGCAHVAVLRPAAKGTVELEAALGGPLFAQAGASVPLTLTSVGARWGFTDRVDAQVHLHPTAALLGTLGFDLGTSVWLVQGERWKPDVTATIRFLGFTDFHRAFRPYLQAAAVASWQVGRFAPYVGLDVMGPGPYVGVAVGLQARFGRFTLQLEGKGFVLSNELRPEIREWVGPNDLAPFGVQLGVAYRLGG